MIIMSYNVRVAIGMRRWLCIFAVWPLEVALQAGPALLVVLFQLSGLQRVLHDPGDVIHLRRTLPFSTLAEEFGEDTTDLTSYGKLLGH